MGSCWCICYASVNIKALETLGYAEHICNYLVILDSWFYGKIYGISKIAGIDNCMAIAKTTIY